MLYEDNSHSGLERRMAQETAASMTAADGQIWRAWLDALLRPKFSTFARWYPRMGRCWRVSSLALSLVLVVITAFIHVVMADLTASQGKFAYLISPGELIRVGFVVTRSVTILLLIPLAIAWIARRRIGPCRLRVHVIYGTWLQAQPAICLLLLISNVAYLIVTANGTAQSSSDFVGLLVTALVLGPQWTSMIISYEALAAGSGRYFLEAGLTAAILAIVTDIIFWNLLGGMVGFHIAFLW
jgi:hypothetical protein